MKYMYRLYADKRHISTIIEVPVMAALDLIAAETFGGFTRMDTVGGWISLDGEKMIVPALVYEVSCDSQQKIRQFAQVMREHLLQECVMIIRFQAEAELVFEDFVREPIDINGDAYKN